MKTTAQAPVATVKTVLLYMLLFVAVTKSQAQQVAPELVFKNAVLETGRSGADNAVYRFPNVMANVDALVKIAGRSSSLVRLESIDISNTGYTNAFQPTVSYNGGSAARYSNWWMDFDISFVKSETNTPVAVSKFDVTALDVDGDGRSLYEYVSFYNAETYTLETNSLLSVQNLLQTLLGILIPGRQFNGPVTNYENIDVRATRVMTTLNYKSKSDFTLRAGAATNSSSSSAAERMYSFWFKGFSYEAPIAITLPVEFHSFSAILSSEKNVDLTWITAMELNVSHFVVERSTDGVHYTEIGLHFAKGNSQEQLRYKHADNLSAVNASLVYYRIKSVDLDGKYKYSDVRTIRIGGEAQKALTVHTYPNPVADQVQVTIPAAWQAKKVVYEVVNPAGQVLVRKEVSNSSQTEVLAINHLAKGYYILTATSNGETAQQKIIKQ